MLFTGANNPWHYLTCKRRRDDNSSKHSALTLCFSKHVVFTHPGTRPAPSQRLSDQQLALRQFRFLWPWDSFFVSLKAGARRLFYWKRSAYTTGKEDMMAIKWNAPTVTLRMAQYTLITDHVWKPSWYWGISNIAINVSMPAVQLPIMVMKGNTKNKCKKICIHFFLISFYAEGTYFSSFFFFLLKRIII